MNRPFNEARYKALLEGLEITIKTVKEFQFNNPTKRLDSEFFKKEYLQIYETLFLNKCEKLEPVTSWITQGPNPLFSDIGIPCLTGRNINKGRVNYENTDFVEDDEFIKLKRFQLKKGDTLITLKGRGSIGKVGYVTNNRNAIFSRDIGIIRPDKINAAYVNAYILSKYGLKIIERGETGGTGQSTLATSYLKNIDIPRFAIENKIGEIIERSENIFNKSNQVYAKAESLLIKTLGLENFEPSNEKVNIKNLKDSFLSSGRLDAEYYQKKYEEIQELITSYKGGSCLVKDMFNHETKIIDRTEKGYNYTEIGDVNINDGTVSSNFVELEGLPANGKLKLSLGNIIISKVRPYRGAVAVIREVPNNYVGSGAFTVLSERGNYSKEVLQVLLHNSIYKELMMKYNVGSSYPIIKDYDILNLPLPIIDHKTQQQISDKVTESFKLKKKSEQLLELAKTAVEMAIEEGEEKAMGLVEEKMLLLNI